MKMVDRFKARYTRVTKSADWAKAVEDTALQDVSRDRSAIAIPAGFGVRLSSAALDFAAPGEYIKHHLIMC